MGLLFNRTPADVRHAERALQHGDAFYHVFVDYADPDVSGPLNRVATAGWQLAQWHVVTIDGKVYGVYLFRRPEQHGAPRP